MVREAPACVLISEREFRPLVCPTTVSVAANAACHHRALPPCAQSGCADIVVGREDGRLEVWDVDETGQPQKVGA